MGFGYLLGYQVGFVTGYEVVQRKSYTARDSFDQKEHQPEEKRGKTDGDKTGKQNVS